MEFFFEELYILNKIKIIITFESESAEKATELSQNFKNKLFHNSSILNTKNADFIDFDFLDFISKKDNYDYIDLKKNKKRILKKYNHSEINALSKKDADKILSLFEKNERNQGIIKKTLKLPYKTTKWAIVSIFENFSQSYKLLKSPKSNFLKKESIEKKEPSKSQYLHIILISILFILISVTIIFGTKAFILVKVFSAFALLMILISLTIILISIYKSNK